MRMKKETMTGRKVQRTSITQHERIRKSHGDHYEHPLMTHIKISDQLVYRLDLVETRSRMRFRAILRPSGSRRVSLEDETPLLLR